MPYNGLTEGLYCYEIYVFDLICNHSLNKFENKILYIIYKRIQKRVLTHSCIYNYILILNLNNVLFDKQYHIEIYYKLKKYLGMYNRQS